MNFGIFSKENKEEYYFLRENKSEQSPHISKITQTYPTDIYADDTFKGKLPFKIQLYLGSLSVIGLYAIFRLLRDKGKQYL